MFIETRRLSYALRAVQREALTNADTLCEANTPPRHRFRQLTSIPLFKLVGGLRIRIPPCDESVSTAVNRTYDRPRGRVRCFSLNLQKRTTANV